MNINSTNCKQDEDNCLKQNPSNKYSFAVLVRHPVVQFVICAVGINVCYLYFGIVQERIYLSLATLPIITTTNKNKSTSHHITAFLLLLQAISNAFAAAIVNHWVVSKRILTTTTAKRISNRNDLPLHHRLLLLTSFSYSLAMTSSNEALNHVSYPIASLAKSCKIVPSMIAEFCLHGHTNQFKYQDLMGAFCFLIGILVFHYCSTTHSTTTSHSNTNQHSNTIGLLLLFLSLAMDGLLSYCQGLLKQKSKTKTTNKNPNSTFRAPTSVETMLWTNLYSIVFFLPYAIGTGQLANGIQLLQLVPNTTNDTTTRDTLRHDMILLSICAAMGQFFIFFTIQLFSPILCTTITTTRKFLSILTSVYKYGHVLSFGQWSSVGLVFFGLYAQLLPQLVVTSSESKKKQH